jgi:hypothetical protein
VLISGRPQWAWYLIDRITYRTRDEIRSQTSYTGGTATEAALARAQRLRDLCAYDQCLQTATRAAKLANTVLYASTFVAVHAAVEDARQAFDSGSGCWRGVKVEIKIDKKWLKDPGFLRKQKELNNAANNGSLVKPSPEVYSNNRGQSTGGHTTSAGDGKDWDHLVELACGGTNSKSNVAPLDSGINRSMGAMLGRVCGALCAGTQVKEIVWQTR